ncbi:MAG: acyltransferase [Chloroflexi bacterium]|nr:acyltransferase [Chloroflexota bacterium]
MQISTSSNRFGMMRSARRLNAILKLVARSYVRIPLRLKLIHLLLSLMPRHLAVHVRPRLYRLIGFKIQRGAAITGNLSIDIHSGSYANLEMGRNSIIGYGCHIALNEKVRIADDAVVGPFVKIFTDSHKMDNPRRRCGHMISQPVTVERGAFIGAGSILLLGVTIGEGAVVGAGTVVTRDVPPQTMAFGNPMRTAGRLSR